MRHVATSPTTRGVEPEKLRALLDVLLSAGVTRAKVPTPHGLFEVEFGIAEAAGPAKDEEPPWNAGDDVEEAIRRANLHAEKKRA